MLGLRGPDPERSYFYGEHPDQVIELWGVGARPSAPLVVLVHGGFWRPEYDRVHLRTLAGAVRATGAVVASLEYRRVPGRPDVLTGDVRAGLALAIAVWRDLGSGAPGCTVVGHSAGGHLALWAATAAADGITHTVALAPVADLRLAHRLDLDGGAVAAFLGAGPDGRADLDPVRCAAPARPVTVVHGTDDGRVPVELAHRYHAAHPGTGLRILPGTGHFELIDPRSAAWPVLRDLLERGPAEGR